MGDVLAFHKDSAGFAKGDYVAFEERRGEKIVVRDEQGRPFAFAPSEVEGFDVGLSRSLPVSVGERLLIRANLKEHKLFNGNIVEVAGIQDDGTLVLTDKRTIPHAFRQFSCGYGTTSHAAQGKTVDRGIVLMAGEGIQAANLRSLGGTPQTGDFCLRSSAQKSHSRNLCLSNSKSLKRHLNHRPQRMS